MKYYSNKFSAITAMALLASLSCTKLNESLPKQFTFGASGGSACTSGADQGSHVIREINNNPNQVTVRFSFSKGNSREEVDAVVAKLKELI